MLLESGQWGIFVVLHIVLSDLLSSSSSSSLSFLEDYRVNVNSHQVYSGKMTASY
jgi:hypothetical protein